MIKDAKQKSEMKNNSQDQNIIYAITNEKTIAI